MSTEVAIRDYLRADESVMALLNGDEKRMNMEWAGDARATHVTLYRAGGDLHDYLPTHSPVIAVHCYGSTRPAASDLAETVALSLRRINQGSKPLLSCTVESLNWLPTPEGVARYVITAVVVAQLASMA